MLVEESLHHASAAACTSKYVKYKISQKYSPRCIASVLHDVQNTNPTAQLFDVNIKSESDPKYVETSRLNLIFVPNECIQYSYIECLHC